nr:hypothetical protein [Tanacetum cinerariifolium]
MLLTEIEDRVISPSSQTISLVDHTIQDTLNVNVGKRKKRMAFVSGSLLVKKAWTEGVVISDSRPSTTGKSPTALRRLIRQSVQADTGSRSAAFVTKDATSSSVTPTPERTPEDDFRDNVRTCPPSGKSPTALRRLIRQSGQAETCSGSAIPAVEDATSSSVTPTPERASKGDFCDNVRTRPPSGRFVVLSFISVDTDIATSPQLRLRYEYEIMTREKYEKKFTDSVVMVQQRDAEVVDLKARLEKSEAKVAEVAEFRKL